ncbi:hypothetical protein [Levilactobacillus enshiensis]|uniref:hypothetical protein n=1 Tax=Levilactobacillus enshiensis TaxID=2590213 RepID=UPI00117A2F36|nr:hypothetical protein [Levilactobacillus enshiensis]
MQIRLKWWLTALVGLVTVGVGGPVANAASTDKTYLAGDVSYVRTKRAMFVGISKKVNGQYHAVKVKKNTLLYVEGTSADHSGVKAAFSYGVVNYNRAQTLKYKNGMTIPFTKANFKPVRLKAPIRTQIFLAGKGFTANAANTNAAPTAGFFLTLDNYLQFYERSAMAKNDFLFGSRRATTNRVYKPTQTVKTTKVTVKGNTTTVYYQQPVKGLPNQKISQGHYRLKITNQKTMGQLGIQLVDGSYAQNATWTNYTVNGKPYHFGEVESADN